MHIRSICSSKIAQSHWSSNWAKIVYLPTQNKIIMNTHYKNNTCTYAKIVHSILQIKGSHLEYCTDSTIILQIYCQKWISQFEIP